MTTMIEMARAESKAARKHWAVGGRGWERAKKAKPCATQPVRERILPFIGSGMSQERVALALGCSRRSICRALAYHSAKL